MKSVRNLTFNGMQEMINIVLLLILGLVSDVITLFHPWKSYGAFDFNPKTISQHIRKNLDK